MRIAFDARSIYQGMGGIGRYAACLIEELGRLDRDDSYVAYYTRLERPTSFRQPPDWASRELEAGMIDERFDQLILPGLLEEDEIDLYFNPAFSVPLVRTRARTVATVHDVVFRRHPELVPSRLRIHLDRATGFARREADRVITGSEFSRREILALYPFQDRVIDVIPYGVHPPPPGPRPSDAPVRARGLVPEHYALYVGSLEPKKNIGLLLKSMAAALNAAPESALALALVGSHDPQAYPLLPMARDLGIERRIHLLGYVPDAELEALYAHAMFFVYPSLYEGFGLPPLEAMARGLPTIVADASSLPEVVGKAALLFPPESPESLARAILELVRYPARRQDLREKGLARAATFSWRRTAERHLEIFHSAMAA